MIHTHVRGRRFATDTRLDGRVHDNTGEVTARRKTQTKQYRGGRKVKLKVS